jgi:hypothetical protein
MNTKFWNLYKADPAKQAVINMFEPPVENELEGLKNILDYSVNWGGDKYEEVNGDLYMLLAANISTSGLIPEGNGEWTRVLFEQLIDGYDIRDIFETEDGQIVVSEDEKDLIMPKDRYRYKLGQLSILSMWLYYNYEFFKPMLLPHRFDVIQRNCDALGLELPPIPKGKDYRTFLMYYYDICEIWNKFQKENGLTDAELCACIYDFASMYVDGENDSDLPVPTNVWLTGASGEGDFARLDNLVKESCWACNERTRKGDVVIVYCKSPRSYIHSIWRAKSGGVFNPFDYYHCRTTVCGGIITPHISINDLKTDAFFKDVPIVRKNLQGVNGVELTAEDYSELLRMISEQGGETDNMPKLYESNGLEFEGIGNGKEKDVEEKILIPALKKLGYSEKDWTRQLKLKKGRTEYEIPDFVFFAKGDSHFETAPFIIEAKLDMSSVLERQRAFRQGRSYAKDLHASLMGICDKERIIIYKVTKEGYCDISNPLFENHWAAIYSDPIVGANLKKIIGKEVVASIK